MDQISLLSPLSSNDRSIPLKGVWNENWGGGGGLDRCKGRGDGLVYFVVMLHY